MSKLHNFSRQVGLISLVLIMLFSSSPVLALTQEDLNAITSDTVWSKSYDPSTCKSATTATGGMDRFFQVLAYQESGGKPDMTSKLSSASGKYAYLDKYWASTAKDYYPPALQYAREYQAPEAVQDALVYLAFTPKFKTYNGDLFKLAVSHFYPLANEKPELLDKNAPGNPITPRQYADKLIKNYSSDVGKDIPINYAAAPDFQTWLTKAGGPYSGTASSTANDSTAAPSGCGAAGIPSNQFVFYSQYDPKWRDHAFGSSTIDASGCGPTSVAMVVATLADQTVTPVETADFGTQNNAYSPGNGSRHIEMLKEGPEHWGLKVQSLGTNLDGAIGIIKQGGLVIASGNGPVPFTSGGHIIVLRGVDANGKILVGDPAHPAANSTAYDSNELLKSISSLWGVTK